MKGSKTKIRSGTLLFVVLSLLTIFIVSGFGYFLLSRDYQSFLSESEEIREHYLSAQKSLLKGEVNKAIEYIAYKWSQTEKRLKSMIRDRTYQAYDMAAAIYEKYRGEKTPEELRRLIVNVLRPIRFNNGRGYYFITGMDGEEILFADRPEFEGQNLLDMRDTEGAYVIRDMIEIIKRAGEGYYRYNWTKPNAQGRGFPKMAYVKYFAPLNAFIGTGEYLDEAEADIQQEVLERIGEIRFGKEGYVFVVSYDGVTLMNGVQPELIGKDMWEMTDPHGVKVIQQERKAAEKPGGDFIYYHWEKPSTNKIVPKISFIKGFPQWRWMVGAGVYVDEIESVIAAKRAEVQKSAHQYLFVLIGVLAGLLILLMVFSYSFSQYFRRQFEVFLAFFKKMETGGAAIDADQFRLQEFELLAESANTMLAKRQQAEAALRESRRVLATLMGNLPGMVYRCHNDADWTMEFVSEGCLELTGYEPADLIRNSVVSYGSLIHEDDREMVDQQVHTAVGQGRPFQLVYRIHAADGRLKWVQEQGRGVFSPDLNLLALEGFIADITESRQAQEEKADLEEQLRQAQKMEAVGTLAGGIAHDFNNLLGAIIGYSELVLDSIESGNPKTQEVQQILTAAERARKLVRHLLTFSRKVEPQLRPLSMNQEVQNALAVLGPTLPKMVHIETRLAPDLKPVRADSNQLQQVLLNLASNAADAMPDGGRLVIETENFVLDDEQARQRLDLRPGPYVLLTVSDTGHGMGERTLRHIFDPFFTTKAVGKGTGLGLSTVYGIVKGHGGHIECASQPGVGSVFKIYLPVHEGEVPDEPEGGGPQKTAGGDETILLVDDEEALRDLGKLILQSVGYKVLLAESGEEALKIIREKMDELDLVVLDLGMPGMGGHKCLREIMALNPEKKVIIASGYAGDDQVRNSLEAGAQGFVAKPYHMRDLLQTVRSVLDGRDPAA